MINCGSRLPANPSFVYLLEICDLIDLLELGGQWFFSLDIYPVPTSITQAGNGPDIVEQLNFRFSNTFTVLNANLVWYFDEKTTPQNECVTTLYHENSQNVQDELKMNHLNELPSGSFCMK